MEAPKIVKFNIGGTKYEVSKSLLDRYSGSMLEKIASERWAGEASGDEIFVDRNGERFQYVLDYMRDGRVELPLSIPRGQFIKDMEYYGLDYADSNITLSVANPHDLFHCLGRYRDYFEEKSAEIEEKYFDVACEKLACAIASEYFSQLLQKGSAKQATRSDGITEGVKYFCPTKINVECPPGHARNRFTADILNKHLITVGLQIIRIGNPPYGSSSSDPVVAYVSVI